MNLDTMQFVTLAYILTTKSPRLAVLYTIKPRCVSLLLTGRKAIIFMGHLQLETGVIETFCRYHCRRSNDL